MSVSKEQPTLLMQAYHCSSVLPVLMLIDKSEYTPFSGKAEADVSEFSPIHFTASSSKKYFSSCFSYPPSPEVTLRFPSVSSMHLIFNPREPKMHVAISNHFHSCLSCIDISLPFCPFLTHVCISSEHFSPKKLLMLVYVSFNPQFHLSALIHFGVYVGLDRLLKSPETNTRK